MKEKEKLSGKADNVPPQEKKPQNTQQDHPRIKKENEDTDVRWEMNNRARKGFQNDGPGGSYGGY